MKAKQKSPIWPYLGILACLFVLSITAPRAWDRMARKDQRTDALEPSASESAPTRWEPLDGDELAPRRAPLKSVTAAPEAPAPPIESPAPQPVVAPPAPEFAIEVPPPAIEPAADAEKNVTSAPQEMSPEGNAESSLAEPAVAESRWPLPRVLLDHLQSVLQDNPSADWAQQSIDLIQELCRAPGDNDRAVTEILGNLRAIVQANVNPDTDGAPGARLVRARYALERWIDIWEPAVLLDESRTSDAPSSEARMAQCLASVDAAMRKHERGAAWRAYLELPTLARLANAGEAADESQRREVARKVLDRLSSSMLSRSQRKFIAEEPIASLEAELRGWAAEEVGSRDLLVHLDEYEQSGLPSDARRVAEDWRGLRWTSNSAAEEASGHLETHYRNANVRLAMSREFFNELLPQPEPYYAPVRDTIVDVPVRGNSATFTKLSVRLIPDSLRIRLGLEANGLVASNTVSSSGPATIRTRGQSTFLVRKLLVLGPQGLDVWPAIAETDNNYNHLISLETDYDGVPLVGSLVRNVARSQLDEQQSTARTEVERKLAHRVLGQFDSEVQPKLVDVAKRIDEQQMGTLKRLGLDLIPVGLSTTEERAVARVLVARPQQLGAHTPRPRAPSDSWVSLQVHESALNNALESLDLNGRSFSLQELFAWIAKKLNQPELANQEDLPEDVHVTFAERDAIRLHCHDNVVDVEFSFARLTQGRNRWRDFTVRSIYQPERKGLTPRFVRDKGTIFLEGKSLKGKPQVALRVIFSRVLSLNRDLSLLNESITGDPRFQNLQFTQFTIDNGWIAMAYAPRSAPAATARKPN